MNKYSIVKQLYHKKKYSQCLDILFEMKKQEKNSYIFEKIAACFY